jgi:hypothetical protein
MSKAQMADGDGEAEGMAASRCSVATGLYTTFTGPIWRFWRVERVAPALDVNLVRIFGMGGDAINGTENEN